MAFSTIKNLLVLSDRFATAGQPTEAELRALAASGFEEVINLGLLDPRYCLADEAGFVASLGLRYLHIPVDFEAPQFADFERFEQALRSASERKVFVHCAANKRVSCFVALFGERALGWTREQADAHVARVWQPNPNWSAFIADARARF